MPAIGLSLLIQIALIIHVLRTGRPMWWIAVILFAPVIGSAVYVVLEILPSFGLFGFLRRAEASALALIDPGREVRDARAALDTAPTMGNRLRLANAYLANEDWQMAEDNFAQCLAGQFADDPAALLGHARALVELGRHEEALARISQLRQVGREGPAEALVFARAAAATGQIGPADEAFAFATKRLPDLEAQARYIRFLRAQGREADALEQLGDLDRRLDKVPAHFKHDAKRWRAHAVATD
jgi:hypothetical protein